MGKRRAERIALNIDVRFFQGKMFYSGTALNLSGNGMYLKTNTCLLSSSRLLVFLFSGGKLLRVTARVKRVSTINHHCDGIGVEILNSPEDYTKLINDLSTRTNSLI